ncbi:MAG: 50S ribosomal protein L19 [Candidatus Portnoybacteria bacterium]|nr:50S ribosomal protein L19 [Candidatus Portnoybacteria bacterium]
MQRLIQKFEKALLNNKFEGIRVGEAIEFTYAFKDGEKERSQKVEGLVIAKKHGEGLNGTIKIRTLIEGVGVERTFPIHSPFVSNVKVKTRYKVRRAKLYYLRELTGKAARLKRIA